MVPCYVDGDPGFGVALGGVSVGSAHIGCRVVHIGRFVPWWVVFGGRR